MIVILKPHATDEQIEHVADRIRQIGLTPHISRGEFRTIIGAIGEERPYQHQPLLEALDEVESVLPIMRPYKLASREFHEQDSVFMVRNVTVGGPNVAIIAGPCVIESREVLFDVAGTVKAAGAHVLRGGAYKPRTSPYSFQGLGRDGLAMLAEARERFDMPVITEVMDPRDVPLVAEYTDIFQIGARNMQNYNLLMEVGKTRIPVFLKRGIAAPTKELLLSAEYVMSEGNHQVMVCERGMRTFETETRFTLDVSAIPVIQEVSHLPVFADPSHAAGRRSLIPALACAAIAAGAHGVMIEVHNCPERALCDGPQAVMPAEFRDLMDRIRRIAQVVGKVFSVSAERASRS